MRVTQSMEQAQFLTALNQLESNISNTQNGISTGLAFTTASENPVGAGLVAGYNQVLAQSQQYTANGQSATDSLNIEDSALTQLQNQLQSLRDLALEANNATESPADLSAIASAGPADPGKHPVARQHPGRLRATTSSPATPRRRSRSRRARPARPTAATRASGRCKSAPGKRW